MESGRSRLSPTAEVIATSEVTSFTQTNSYSGHPGYSFNRDTGSYQYGSGYQNNYNAEIQTSSHSLKSDTNNEKTAVQSKDSNINNRYTHAGINHTNNTLSSHTGIQGQTFAYQYSLQGANNETLNYFTNPYGGDAGLTNIEGNVAPQGPITYMHSGNTSTTTTSSSGKKSLSSSSSNNYEKPNISENISLSHTQSTTESKDSNINHNDTFKEDHNETKCYSVVVDDEQDGDDKQQLNDIETLFFKEVDRLEELIVGLKPVASQTPIHLDPKWVTKVPDAILEATEIAKCNPLKNRCAFSIPFDHSRIILQNSECDYINASSVKGLTKLSPDFIIAQSPMKSTISDFWCMALEQKVEVILCLLAEDEIEPLYFPSKYEAECTYGDFTITVLKSTHKTHCIERLLCIKKKEEPLIKLTHLQINSLKNAEDLVGVAKEMLSAYEKQKSLSNPILVHCLLGEELCGRVCLTACYIQAAKHNEPNVADIIEASKVLGGLRKNAVKNSKDLLAVFQAALCIANKELNIQPHKTVETEDTNDLHLFEHTKRSRLSEEV